MLIKTFVTLPIAHNLTNQIILKHYDSSFYMGNTSHHDTIYQKDKWNTKSCVLFPLLSKEGHENDTLGMNDMC